MDNKHLIIYHKEDNDGLFSMAIIYNYLINEKKLNKKQIEIFGAGYNDIDKISLSALTNNYSYLYLTDISFDDYKKLETLYRIYKDKLIWIDHHKPIIDKSKQYGFDSIKGLRDIKHSALYNAFLYFYPDKEIPELFKLLSAYDSFTFEENGYTFETVTNINTGVYNRYDLNINNIINYVYEHIYEPKLFNENELTELHFFGETENEAFARFHKNVIEQFGDFSWTVNGNKACALFMQGASYSYMFKSVADKINHGVVFKHLPDGKWTLSLYNTKEDIDFHCGEYLATNYDGGGHKGAAGAQITQEKFIELLKNKTI